MAISTVETVASTFERLLPSKLRLSKQGPNRFDELVQALKLALGPSSGLDSDDVDIEYLTSVMREYDSVESEWSRFAFADASRGYTRNLVDDGNGKSNLVSQPAMAATPPEPIHRDDGVSLTVYDHSLSLCGRRARAVPSTTTATPTA